MFPKIKTQLHGRHLVIVLKQVNAMSVEDIQNHF